jgi:hypothetical protein
MARKHWPMPIPALLARSTLSGSVLPQPLQLHCNAISSAATPPAPPRGPQLRRNVASSAAT